MKIRAIIVDDEFPSRQELRYILEQYPELEIIGEFQSGSGVLKFLQQTPTPDADIIFLDIQMPKMTGIEVAKEIGKITEKPHLVFATGYPEFAIQAFDLAIFDYILKPYNEERVRKTLARLTAQLRQHERLQSQNTVTVDSDDHTFSIVTADTRNIIVLNPQEELVLVKSIKGDSPQFYTTRGILQSKVLLRDIEAQLRPYSFIRTHKSYIVNLKMIREIKPWFNDTYVLTMENYTDEEIPVSRHYLKEFKATMKL